MIVDLRAVRTLIIFLVVGGLAGPVLSRLAAAEKLPPLKLIDAARQKPGSPEFRDSLVETLGAERVRAGTAVAGEGPEFIWAVEAKTAPTLVVDGSDRPAMTRIEGSDLWFALGKLTPGWSHAFHYRVGGQSFGGDLNVPAYLPDSYAQPGVPLGKLSERTLHRSKIYDGMESEYWVYVPAQYSPGVPAAVMVWNDGGKHADRNGATRTQILIDNLTHQKKIPVIVHVFINPGDISKAEGTRTHEYVSTFSRKTGRTLRDSMRSTEYDTVSDRYVRFLRDEILAEVGQNLKLRKDGYSRAIVGESSGGIAAFNAAWQMPDEFSRAYTRIGTVTSIQWEPGVLEGGHAFPFMVRKQPKRNIRVWMSGGSEDLENPHGSWPLQNIQMANSLKMREYDFVFRFGTGSHHGAHGNAEAPEALAWLWRDYDTAKTAQAYEMDPAEKTKPYYRVRVINREYRPL